jgi:hypothetical protein
MVKLPRTHAHAITVALIRTGSFRITEVRKLAQELLRSAVSCTIIENPFKEICALYQAF